jgi:hypothetical protein
MLSFAPNCTCKGVVVIIISKHQTPKKRTTHTHTHMRERREKRALTYYGMVKPLFYHGIVELLPITYHGIVKPFANSIMYH